MFYHLFYEYFFNPDEWTSFLRVFKYITFRTAASAITSLLLSLVIGRILIKILKSNDFTQVVKKEYLPNHGYKSNIPTAGGIIMLLAIVISGLLWARLDNRFTWLFLFIAIALGFLGFLDDYLKVKHQNPKGLTKIQKILGQILVGSILALTIYLYPLHPHYNLCVYVPYTKDVILNLGILYFLFVILIITSSSNAANLTDGLDGLAIGLVILGCISLLILSYIAGHFKIAQYLKVWHVKEAGELTVLIGSLFGACVGFLWYNSHPAQVFMGDTGALFLGGLLGFCCIAIKQELLLLLIGGIFVIETLSTLLQIFSVRLFGKKLFLISPLHHHYEAKGYQETKIVIRFWIIAGILNILALTSLKIR